MNDVVSRVLPIVAPAIGVAFSILLSALFLRALCLGDVPTRTLVRAATRASVLPALWCIAAWFTGVSLLSPIPWVLWLVGLVFAIAPLRGKVRGPDRGSERGEARGRFVTGALVLAATAAAVGEYHARFHETARTEERAAQAADEAPPFERAAPKTLDLAGGVVAKGPWRDAAVDFDATLDPGAIMHVRVRAPNVAWPFGVSFFLSADPRFPSGFVEETKVSFSRLGDPAGVVDPGRPVSVRVEARGRDFVATVDGAVVARAETRRYASGAVLLLSARGVTIASGVTVSPIEHDEPPVGVVSDAARGAGGILVIGLALALLASFVSRSPFSRTLEAGSFGLLPFAFFLSTSDPAEAPDSIRLAGLLAVASVMMLLYPLVHRERSTGLRYASFAAAVAAAAFFGFLVGRERAWPAEFQEENELSVVDWEGDRQHADLIHFTHPVLRRWNNYLGDHTLRLLRHDREGAEGTARVAAVGTSSTHGYWLQIPTAYQLHLLLEAESRVVETLIAAVPGSTGPRLYWFARNVVLEYSPEVLILTLTFNDAYALTQMDEGEYLKRITAEGYSRGPLQRLQDRLSVTFGGSLLRSALDDFASGDEIDLEHLPGGAPPSRFERMLDDFATICAERGTTLVLVKEPLRGDVDRLFKEEFYAAIDRVAEKRSVRVVDPRPLLAERGGAELFMDQVHPLADGAQVIAEAMKPVVVEALDAREE